MIKYIKDSLFPTEEQDSDSDSSDSSSGSDSGDDSSDDCPYEDNEKYYNAVFSILHKQKCKELGRDRLYVLAQVNKEFIDKEYSDGDHWEYDHGDEVSLYFMDDFDAWADLMNVFLEHDDILPVKMIEFSDMIEYFEYNEDLANIKTMTHLPKK